MKRAVWLAAVLWMAWPLGSAGAYSEEIANVEYDKVFQAVFDVLQPLGIREAKIDKGRVESNWVEDKVERRRGLTAFLMPKRMIRRTRIRVDLKKKHYSTDITVTGIFRERDPGNTRGLWKQFKPDREEYSLEREYFSKILRRLEEIQQSLPPAPSETAPAADTSLSEQP